MTLDAGSFEQIKALIRENLVIRVECLNKYEPGNDVIVSIGFVGEASFSEVVINIPAEYPGDNT